MSASNSTFRLFRRAPGEGDEAWIETGETYRTDEDCGAEPDQRLPLDDFLALRQIEDGWEYEARPA